MDAGADYLSLRAIVEGVTRRWLTLLGSMGAPGTPVPDLSWNTGELTAHVISVVESFDCYVGTQVGPEYPYDRLTEFNRSRMARVAERDPAESARRLERAMTGFLQRTRQSDPTDPVPWFDGHIVDISTAHAVLAAELLVHGRDLARARRVSWPIPAAEARHTIIGMLPAVPATADPVTAADTDFHARVRLWGSPPFGFRVLGGKVEITDGSDRADVTLWAHPTSFLLASFGRVSPLRLAMRGRALAWGRRPWLALTLPRLFRT